MAPMRLRFTIRDILWSFTVVILLAVVYRLWSHSQQYRNVVPTVAPQRFVLFDSFDFEAPTPTNKSCHVTGAAIVGPDAILELELHRTAHPMEPFTEETLIKRMSVGEGRHGIAYFVTEHPRSVEIDLYCGEHFSTSIPRYPGLVGKSFRSNLHHSLYDEDEWFCLLFDGDNTGGQDTRIHAILRRVEVK